MTERGRQGGQSFNSRKRPAATVSQQQQSRPRESAQNRYPDLMPPTGFGSRPGPNQTTRGQGRFRPANPPQTSTVGGTSVYRSTGTVSRHGDGRNQPNMPNQSNQMYRQQPSSSQNNQQSFRSGNPISQKAAFHGQERGVGRPDCVPALPDAGGDRWTGHQLQFPGNTFGQGSYMMDQRFDSQQFAMAQHMGQGQYPGCYGDARGGSMPFYSSPASADTAPFPFPYPNPGSGVAQGYGMDWAPSGGPYSAAPSTLQQHQHQPQQQQQQQQQQSVETKKETPQKKTASASHEDTLHVVSCNVGSLKRWNKFKDRIQMLFEVFGYLDSAVVSDRQGSKKEFLLRDERKDTLQCVFYEIDRSLPKMTRGQWQRCVGTLDTKTGTLKCVSARTVSEDERKLAAVLIRVSDQKMTQLTRTLSES